MRAGLGFVWGSFSLDMQDAVGWLGLIRARCAAGLAVAVGLLQGCGSASFGPGLVVATNPSPKLQNHIPEATRQPRLTQPHI